jgi:hypothetical protein
MPNEFMAVPAAKLPVLPPMLTALSALRTDSSSLFYLEESLALLAMHPFFLTSCGIMDYAIAFTLSILETTIGQPIEESFLLARPGIIDLEKRNLLIPSKCAFQCSSKVDGYQLR